MKMYLKCIYNVFTYKLSKIKRHAPSTIACYILSHFHLRYLLNFRSYEHTCPTISIKQAFQNSNPKIQLTAFLCLKSHRKTFL